MSDSTPPEKSGEVRKIKFSLFSKLALGFSVILLLFLSSSNGYLLRYFFDDKLKYVLYSLHQSSIAFCSRFESRTTVPLLAELKDVLKDEDFASAVLLSPVGQEKQYKVDTVIDLYNDGTKSNVLGAYVSKRVLQELKKTSFASFTFQIETTTKHAKKTSLLVSACKLAPNASADVARSSWAAFYVDTSEALRPAKMIVLKMGLWFTVFALIALAGVLCLAKSLTKPIQALTSAADEVAAGNYNSVIDVNNSDELGVLSDHFKILASRLEQREAELEKSTEAANQDFLTGLWNRRFFEKRGKELFQLSKRHKRELSIIYMDADHFKKVNDTYGHDAGDTVLKDFAKIMHDCTRDTDVVARLGGEEFAIFLPETNHEGAVKVAQNILEKIRGFEFVQDVKHKMTASMGVVTRSEVNQYESVDDMIKLSDERAYNSKKTGRNRVTYESGVWF